MYPQDPTLEDFISPSDDFDTVSNAFKREKNSSVMDMWWFSPESSMLSRKWTLGECVSDAHDESLVSWEWRPDASNGIKLDRANGFDFELSKIFRKICKPRIRSKARLKVWCSDIASEIWLHHCQFTWRDIEITFYVTSITVEYLTILYSNSRASLSWFDPEQERREPI